ncbi:MAG TPA: type II secretion system protein GspG [Enhygromyxa sp.]|nr:type II secretion system protein GspG [Enhygromyxa sp.]
MRLSIITLAIILALGCDAKDKAQQEGVVERLDAARVEHAGLEILRLRQSVDLYRIEKLECPNGVQDLVAAQIEPKPIEDPWGNEFVFTCPGEHDEVDIVSPGKDGKLGTADDIQSWTLSPRAGDR